MTAVPPAPRPTELTGRIGVAGAVFTLMGYIVGGSIFILPGALAGQIGPGAFIAYLGASVIAIFVCVTSAQIGTAFPTSGGAYVGVSNVIGPFWGFMVAWMGLLIIFTSTSALAYGLVDYISVYVPALVEFRVAGAVASVLLFTYVNLLGIRMAAGVQGVMVIGFMAILLLFGIGGVISSEPENLVPLFPLGLEPVLLAAIPAYYSYSGFSAVMAFGGEIRNPRRNIPLSLLISFPIILITYTLVTIAMPGLIPWRELATTKAGVPQAAAAFLPAPLPGVIAVGAMLAMATSINGLILSKSRDVFALAVARVLPGNLALVGRRHGEPRAALILMGAVATAGILMQRSFVEYASMSVLCVMVIHIMIGVAVVLLPTRQPACFEASSLKLGRGARIFWGAGMVVCSSGLIVAGLLGRWAGAVLYVVMCGLGGLGYWLRRRYLLGQGVRIEELIARQAASLLRKSADEAAS